MRENARQGYFNGSRAPFGYEAVATEALGNRCRRKKKLAIHEGEAAIVRRIYELYLTGHDGRTVGIKEIVKLLNDSGQPMRGGPWSIQKVHKVLSLPTYHGEFYYNVIDSRAGKKRPPSEWIAVQVDPIIDAQTFERVRQRREGRRPSAVPPRRLSSPTLLTGLLKCGHCGRHDAGDRYRGMYARVFDYDIRDDEIDDQLYLNLNQASAGYERFTREAVSP